MNAMPPFEHQYPTVGSLIAAIAGWCRKWRHESETANLETWLPGDVERIARDVGVTVAELRALERTDQPLLVPRMLAALKIDAAELARTQPAALRDLQRVCSICDSKRRCRTELAAGDAARTYEAFCPNALTLRMVRDFGVTVAELRALERTDQPLLLPRMLAALKIDAAELARTQPAALRDLQRVCSLCDSKRRCRSELAARDAARTYEGFCPNALTLKTLVS